VSSFAILPPDACSRDRSGVFARSERRNVITHGYDTMFFFLAQEFCAISLHIPRFNNMTDYCKIKTQKSYWLKKLDKCKIDMLK